MDTSSLINLLATGCELEILAALDWNLVISKHTEGETLYLSSAPDEAGRRSRVRADLSGLKGSGRLTIRALDEEWSDAFVQCAEHLPDADASAVALAEHLRTGLATDDPKEAKVARWLFGQIDVVSTLDWLHEAASALGWPETRLVEVARNLRWRGNFLPPRDHPQRAWYLGLLERA
jgi:hypothetical protein